MMTRVEFLQTLEQELASFPTEERVAALQYFTMYFDDAGPDREQEVMQELGSPQKVAQDIRSQSEGDGWTPPAKVEAIRSEWAAATPPTAPGAPPPAQAQPGQPPVAQPTPGTPAPYAPPAESNNTALRTILIVLAVIFLSPLIGGLAAVLISLLACLVVVLLLPLILGIAFVGAGLALVVGAIYLLLYTLPNGLIFLGSALILVGLGALCIYGGIWLMKKVLPAVFRGLANFFGGIFRRKGTVKQ